jgi:hypothetical protein
VSAAEGGHLLDALDEGGVVDTAGLLEGLEPSPEEARRQALSAVRTVLRKLDASDDEYDDALDALIELAVSAGAAPTPK